MACPENPPWWKGTTIAFELTGSEDGGTSILFTHGGFDADDPMIGVITPAWVRCLDNLIDVAQSGAPRPDRSLVPTTNGPRAQVVVTAREAEI